MEVGQKKIAEPNGWMTKEIVSYSKVLWLKWTQLERCNPMAWFPSKDAYIITSHSKYTHTHTMLVVACSPWLDPGRVT